MMHRRWFLLGGLALAGCSAPAVNYRLAAQRGPIAGQTTAAIAVRGVNIPGYLDQNGIGRLSGAYQYATYPNDVWAEPLAEMLQAVMVQDLSQRLPAATVIASGGAIGAPTQAVVEINILRFDPDPEGRVNLTMQISVRHGSDNRLWQTVNYSRVAPLAGQDAQDVVGAMSALWAQAADQIAVMLAG
jgi:uncharacterized lipoprotein YmbA